MSDLRLFISFCHPCSLTSMFNSVGKYPTYSAWRRLLRFFSKGIWQEGIFEESVGCRHLCTTRTGELAGGAALHFSPFAGSCYSCITFCLSVPLVIGGREAEMPYQLILSLQLSLTSSEKHTHCFHGRAKLVEILFSPLNLYLEKGSVSKYSLPCTVFNCRILPEQKILVGRWFSSHGMMYFYKSKFTISPLLPPCAPVVTRSHLGMLLTSHLSICMLLVRLGFSSFWLCTISF